MARRVSCLIDEEGRVLKYYPQVSPREHVAEVLRDLTE
jgi:peroxiredoxin